MGDTAAQVRKEIAACYTIMDDSAVKRDAETMLSYYSPKYTQITRAGKKLTLAMIRKEVPKMLKMANRVESKTTIDSLKMKGPEAVVQTRDHTELDLVNPKNVSQVLKLVIDSKNEEIWTKTAKGWRKKASKSLMLKQTANGHKVKGSD
jgi:hypothetical protein